MNRPAGPTERTCFNCATVLGGPFCHRCGQEAGPTHRSLLHIGAEFVEALTHGDGRLRRTLRLLALHPGRLTRDWLDGRRVADIPPIRVFFWSLFCLFLVGSLSGAVHVGPLAGTSAADAKIRTIRIGHHPLLERWLRVHLGRAANDPAAVVREMGDWAERATLLMLPVAALSSKLLFLGRRPAIRFFDHVIFAMHSLAFAMLLLAAAAIAAGWWDDAGLLLLLIPVHVFRHLRGAFGGGRVATAIRVCLLVGGEFCGFGAIVVLLALVGLEFG